MVMKMTGRDKTTCHGNERDSEITGRDRTRKVVLCPSLIVTFSHKSNT